MASLGTAASKVDWQDSFSLYNVGLCHSRALDHTAERGWLRTETEKDCPQDAGDTKSAVGLQTHAYQYVYMLD